jgi:hypothetical protein
LPNPPKSQKKSSRKIIPAGQRDEEALYHPISDQCDEAGYYIKPTNKSGYFPFFFLFRLFEVFDIDIKNKQTAYDIQRDCIIKIANCVATEHL